MRRIRTSCKEAVKKRRKEIHKSLRKAGIKSLQEVLNTSILSNDAKIKHIRHTYTCYDKYLKTFYRDGYGVTLRNELNDFIRGLVDGEYTVDDLKAFNKQLKIKLKAANDNYINEQKSLFELSNPEQKIIEEPIKELATEVIEDSNILSNDELKHINYNEDIHKKAEIGLELLTSGGITISDRDKDELDFLPREMLLSKHSVNQKIVKINNWLKNRRESWKIVYRDLSIKHTRNEMKYVVELYLENRSSNFYPADFSDLNFLKWNEVKRKAMEWLIAKFEGDVSKYNRFLSTTLQKWIEENADNHEDKILERLL